MKKIISIISIIIFTLVLCGLAYKKSLLTPPDYNALNALPNLTNSVEVNWDKEGIPHLKAENVEDAYRTLGFIMAQERLFQMDIYRRAAEGSVGELFGKSALGVDRTAKIMEFSKVFKEKIQKGEIDSQTLKYLEAFFSGVNHFIETQKLPWEYSLLGLKPRPFKPLDAYGFIGLMSFQFSPAPKIEFIFSELKSKFAPWQWSEFRDLKKVTSSTVLNFKKFKSALQETSTIAEASSDQSYLTMDDIVYLEGSNGWVIDGSHTASGKPILANDPHIGFSLPGIWFEAHIQTKNFEVYGHFLPLFPFAVIGHNRRHAWGVTLTYVDDMDFFKETINWNDKTYQLPDGTWKPLEVVNETLYDKDKPQAFTYYKTPRGVVLNNFEGLRDLSGKKDISVSWVWDKEGNSPLKGLKELNFAQGIDEFEKALQYVYAPGLNIMFADKENIAKWVVGAVPKRSDSVDSWLILDAKKENDLHLGLHSFDERKHLWKNPQDGFIVSANDKSPNYSEWLRGYFLPKDRYDIILENLQKSSASQKLTKEIVAKIQTDISASMHKEMLMNMLAEVKIPKGYESEFTMLKNWKGTYEKSSVPALVFVKWTQILLQEIFSSYLNEKDFFRLSAIGHSWNFIKYLCLNKLSDKWYDNPQTSEVETKAMTLQKTLLMTFAALKNSHGSNIKNWQWGNEHTIAFNHNFSKIPLIGKYFQLGPYPVKGAYNTTNNFRRVGDQDGLAVKAGPSTRRVLDLMDLKDSLGILPIGNSANPESPFFKNQLERFLNSEFRSQKLDLDPFKDIFATQKFKKQ